MAPQHGLVQWRRMRMIAFKVAVGILVGVERQANDLRLSVLRSRGQCPVARFGVRDGSRRAASSEAQTGSGGQLSWLSYALARIGCAARDPENPGPGRPIAMRNPTGIARRDFCCKTA
jgi:hypothetical protein